MQGGKRVTDAQIDAVFMPFAWYGHLKYKSTPLMIAILVS
ncbi:DMT family protein, partial [Xanthomonas campestris pv. campestris]|nr:DMT family protein [Xanthomonas campestris pv. campestris]